MVDSVRVLSALAASLQRLGAGVSDLTHPVLVWHRTVQRPVMVLFHWRTMPVHVTYGNQSGVRASNFLWCTLANKPALHRVLLHWKTELRRKTNLVGPHVGQVSTYALVHIAREALSRLQVGDLRNESEYEQAHACTCGLYSGPHSRWTQDPRWHGAGNQPDVPVLPGKETGQ